MRSCRDHRPPYLVCDLVKYWSNGRIDEVPALDESAGSSPMAVLQHDYDWKSVFDIAVRPHDLVYATLTAYFEPPRRLCATRVLRRSCSECGYTFLPIRIQHGIDVEFRQVLQKPLSLVEGAPCYVVNHQAPF